MINIRKYLPTDSVLYEDIVFNFLQKENTILRFGDKLVIERDLNDFHDDGMNIWQSNYMWKICLNGKPILNMITVEYPLSPAEYNVYYGKNKRYSFYFQNDKSLTFETNRYRTFNIDDAHYMMKNYFNELIAMKFMMMKLYHYVIKLLELKANKTHVVDLENFHNKFEKFESIDQTHKFFLEYLKENNENQIQKY